MIRPLFERVTLPGKRLGTRTVALRYGEPRAMAVLAALCLCLHQVAGLRNRTLHPLVETLFGAPYPSSRMSYDLWRLQVNGLIRRVPATHRWQLTPEGVQTALFLTKSYRRLIDPLFAAAEADAHPVRDPELRAALRTIQTTLDRYADDAKLAA
jgi:hypothetical protein